MVTSHRTLSMRRKMLGCEISYDREGNKTKPTNYIYERRSETTCQRGLVVQKRVKRCFAVIVEVVMRIFHTFLKLGLLLNECWVCTQAEQLLVRSLVCDTRNRETISHVCFPPGSEAFFCFAPSRSFWLRVIDPSFQRYVDYHTWNAERSQPAHT